MICNVNCLAIAIGTLGVVIMFSGQKEKKILLATIAYASVFYLNACKTTVNPIGNSSTAKGAIVTETFDPERFDRLQTSKSYTPETLEKTVQIGDIATITVNGFDEFSGLYTVDNNGNIFLAHVGAVSVIGKTIPQLQTELYTRYNTCCLVNPNVSIEIEKQVFGKIVVDGAVSSAGVFEIDTVIRLSEAIALAGGLTEIAEPELTILSREIEGKRKTSTIDLAAIQKFGQNDPSIYPNDVIFVQDSKGRQLYENFVKTLPLISAILLATTR